jgi:hypothetical protein
MIYFLITGRMLTPEVIRHLPPEQRPQDDASEFDGTFSDVLPYWREAFGRVLVGFRDKLPVDAKGNLSQAGEALLCALVELAEPNPALRGHPHNRVGHNDPLGVQQYITLFDSLRRRAMH